MITVFDIIAEAKEAAMIGTTDYVQNVLGGEDAYPCGFAWVTIYEHDGKKIRKNSKVGKALEAAGARKTIGIDGGFRIWNPSGTMLQNLDCKEAGARAAADVLKQYGFTAYAGGRMD